MTTITDIREDLIAVFNKLKAGTMEAKDAFEINNTAGKIISSAKVQLAYAALRGEKPNIPFLGVNGPAIEAPKPSAPPAATAPALPGKANFASALFPSPKDFDKGAKP
jgi:hypothetical protein